MRAPFRLAFVVRNEFMFLQIEKLWTSYEQADVLLLGEITEWDPFLARQHGAEAKRFKKVSYFELVQLDGTYDALFVQTPFPLIEKLERSRLITVQYGLAKERHNYGVWRSLADLNLMYGPYSTSAVSIFSNSISVGNLKFAGVNLWGDKQVRKILKELHGLDADKQTILYMPTYRDLGSFEKLLNPLSRMLSRYNILIKIHHNQETHSDFTWKDRASSLGFKHLYGGNSNQGDLLNLCDVVISDFSGAIFDGLYARKPLVLYQEGAERLVGTQSFDLESIEYRRRHELGIVCESPEDLAAAVEAAKGFAIKMQHQLDTIRAELMTDVSDPDVLETAKRAVDDLLTGHYERPSRAQLYVRDMYKSLRSAERELAALKRKPLWRRLLRM
ncbi:hypothetical protein ASG58_16975 [Rhizobium sp. Leaf383]|nr:hypothetical protein ASG58_16975 [Rhizobium sp. Leaf383]